MARSTPTPEKATPRKRGEREYLIRRRLSDADLVSLKAGHAWLEVGTVMATTGARALDAYAATQGDDFDGGAHEAITSRYRHEATATKNVQTTIKWA